MTTTLHKLEVPIALAARGKTLVLWRAMKPQPPAWITSMGFTCFTPQGSASGRGNYEQEGPAEKFFKMPFHPGQSARWREAWSRHIQPDWAFMGAGEPFCVFKDGGQTFSFIPQDSPLHYSPGLLEYDDGAFDGCRWLPATTMPAWASRFPSTILSVRPMRLCDATEEDAAASGCFLDRCECMPRQRDSGMMTAFTLEWCHIHGHSLKALWKEMHGTRHPWDSWVWKIKVRFEEGTHA